MFIGACPPWHRAVLRGEDAEGGPGARVAAIKRSCLSQFLKINVTRCVGNKASSINRGTARAVSQGDSELSLRVMFDGVGWCTL